MSDVLRRQLAEKTHRTARETAIPTKLAPSHSFDFISTGAISFPVRKVLILGGDFDHNLGDAATLSALCHCLVKARPDLKITISSSKAQHSTLPGVVETIPRNFRNAAKLMSVAHHQDLIILGGGGLFQDDDSRVKMPFWAAYLRMLARLNPNIVALGLGAGPLKHWESQQCARLATSVVRSISVRDEFARSWLNKCTNQQIKIVPDLAFMLPAASQEVADECLRSAGLLPGQRIIGVALRRWFHQLGGFVPHRFRARMALDRNSGRREFEQFLDQLARSLRSLAMRLDASVLFMPTYNIEHEADDAASVQLMEKLSGVNCRMFTTSDPHSYKAVTGKLTLMLSMRMHPLILSASMGTPIVGLAYNGKFEGLMKSLQVESQLLWLNDFKHKDLADHLQRIALEAIDSSALVKSRAASLTQLARRHTEKLVSTVMWHIGGVDRR